MFEPIARLADVDQLASFTPSENERFRHAAMGGMLENGLAASWEAVPEAERTMSAPLDYQLFSRVGTWLLLNRHR